AVAVDPSPRGLAYVFFENGKLLDWGHRRCGRSETEVLAFLGELLAGCAADLLVIEDPDAEGAKRWRRSSRLLRKMANRARTLEVAVFPTSRRKVRLHWVARGLSTKESVAVALAAQFPELASLVPPRRKTWMSEHPNSSIFDALTLLLHACS
ncbi:MAG: hypothetical protein ABI837_17730, partial [Acidobacteriota bacterium]